MPSRETVEAFMSLVEAGEYLKALEAYYDEDASIQENGDAPRRGLPELLKGERRTLAAFETVRCRRLAEPAVDGDRVAIAWRFEFTPAGGQARTLEEIGWQRWSGDRIVEERFFYDPRQLAG